MTKTTLTITEVCRNLPTVNLLTWDIVLVLSTMGVCTLILLVVITSRQR